MKTPITHYHENLALYSKALSHPIRIYILESLLKNTQLLSGDLFTQLPIARSTLSQHLKELKESGLIIGKEEPPKIIYSINQKKWEEAKHLLNTFFK